ncbi:SDR family oxidoreductase [Planctomyces sp. SH-PL62]|uniref:SDR family oxidoreductase n=1 Tax=Planctomyces sp. SH-PL62 TaxID=1636152 RepID=UPI00078EBDCB|nr:SDR family oxidoreductase [Planctomyces sp. SH-PL62]AMV36699.1 dTDP-4-dehydrorhamnose reductase [Planctomyces sp. SH-PL62]
MRIVLTGATGRLGAYLQRPLARTGWEVVAWSGTTGAQWNGAPTITVDVADPAAIARELDRADPDAVLHAAAISDVESCRRDPRRARAVNVEAVASVARWCASRGRRLLFTSTDMVFDGARPWAVEADEPRPILAYGASKREAEIEAGKAPDAVVARIGLLYGPTRSGRETFYDKAVAGLRAGVPQTFFDDEFRTSLDYRSAAEALVGLLASDFRGVVHVGGRERISRFELMSRVARGLGLDAALVQANSRADVPFAEPRPADLSMETSRLADLLPGLERPPVEEAVRAMERESGG